MTRNMHFKVLIVMALLSSVTIVSFFSGKIAHATGETWELVNKTTIKISGGVFTGPITWSANGKQGTTPTPTSITLTPRGGNPNVNPSIWIATRQFDVTDKTGNPLEDKPREQGQFCIAMTGTSYGDLVQYGTPASFKPIHREDCQKISDIRYISPTDAQYSRCGGLFGNDTTSGWRCNTLWKTANNNGYMSAGITIKSDLQPTTTCGSSTDKGDVIKCQTVTACTQDAHKSKSECSSGWDACVASYKGSDESDLDMYDNCGKYVATGDFNTGKYIKPADTTQGSSCQVTGIGWILCPVANAMASMADWAFTVVAAFMNVSPLQFNDPLYRTWTTMRNIANVAFVIAFLIIIYSQITGGGLTNYSLKKMLPRLIVAAILVNLSYYICAIAVDLSNILGVSVQHIFDGIRQTVSSNPTTSTENTWSSVTTVVLAGAGAAVGGVAFSALSSTTIMGALVGLLPMLIAALFALMIAFLVLLARQALIIMLIVIAPLAFVAYLLPNTEEWFQKWRKLFTTLLVLFPVMSIIFGGSQLAGAILQINAQTLLKSDNVGTGLTGLFMYIGSLAVQAIPFFITPLLIRISSGVLGKFAGMVNNRNKGPFDRANKWAQQKAKNANNKGYTNSLKRKGGLSFLGYGARRRANNNGENASLEQEAKRQESSYLAGEMQTNTSLQRRMAGSNDPAALQRVLASAISTDFKLEAEEVTAAQAIIKNANLGLDQMQQLAKGQNVSYIDKNGVEQEITNTLGTSLQTAAIQNQFKVGDVNKTDELVANSGAMGLQQRQAVAEGMQAMTGKVKYYGGMASQNAAQGKINSEDDLDREVLETISGKKIGEQDLAVADKDALSRISKVLATNSAPTGNEEEDDRIANGKEVLKKVAIQLQNNDRIFPTVAVRNQNRIDAIGKGNLFQEENYMEPTPPPTPPPAPSTP